MYRHVLCWLLLHVCDIFVQQLQLNACLVVATLIGSVTPPSDVIVSGRTGLEVVVRSCSIESLSSQCGTFSFDGEYFHGCLTTCHWDGCNGAVPSARDVTRSYQQRLLYLCSASVIVLKTVVADLWAVT